MPPVISRTVAPTARADRWEARSAAPRPGPSWRGRVLVRVRRAGTPHIVGSEQGAQRDLVRDGAGMLLSGQDGTKCRTDRGSGTGPQMKRRRTRDSDSSQTVE
jgi:hypothetical protein